MISHDTKDNLEAVAAVLSICSALGLFGVIGWIVRNAHRHKETSGVLHHRGILKLFDKETGD